MRRTRVLWAPLLLFSLFPMALLQTSCCTCRKKPYANIQEYDKARARAVVVADAVMEAIVRFDELSPEAAEVEWDLQKLRKNGYRVSYQGGFLTLKKDWKRWDVYFISLGQCFSPKLRQKGQRLVIHFKPFPPESDPTVIIDHGSYGMDLLEDRLYNWNWYLRPWPSASESLNQVAWPDELELRTATEAEMEQCR